MHAWKLYLRTKGSDFMAWLGNDVLAYTEKVHPDFKNAGQIIMCVTVERDIAKFPLSNTWTKQVNSSKIKTTLSVTKILEHAIKNWDIPA